MQWFLAVEHCSCCAAAVEAAVPALHHCCCCAAASIDSCAHPTFSAAVSGGGYSSDRRAEEQNSVMHCTFVLRHVYGNLCVNKVCCWTTLTTGLSTDHCKMHLQGERLCKYEL